MKGIFGYFDLNKRAMRAQTRKETFKPDLTAADKRAQHPLKPKIEEKLQPSSLPPKSNRMPWAEQVLMYVGVVTGVIFSSAVTQFQLGKAVSFNLTLTTIFVSAIIALVIIPVVFERLSVKPDGPFLVRFGLFVQHGVFWQVLFGFIGKTIVG
jgi:hypothetical protein